jgi:hypothetical protein
MQPRRVIAVMFAAALALPAQPLAAQCNPSCQGDFNSDQQVTIAELVTAVGNALGGCEASPEQQGCLASGGSVSTASCCVTAPEFPDTCGIGPCGCAPQSSRDVTVCDCGGGRCFDRDQRACVP